MNYRSNFLVISALFFTMIPANGMHKAAQYCLNGSKAINWVGAVGGPLLEVYTKFPQANDPGLLALPDASPELTTWVRSELKKSGIANPESIYIKVHDDPDCFSPWSQAGIDTIMCKKNEADELEKLFTEKKYSDPKVLVATSILRHEAGHYVNRDSENRKYANVAFALTNHLAWQSAIEGVRKLATRNIGLCMNYPNLMKFAFSAVHFKSLDWKWQTWQSNILQSWFFRHCERKADEYAFKYAQSKQELEQVIELYQNRHQSILTEIRHEMDSVKQNPETSYHPEFERCLNRIQVLYKLTSQNVPFNNWLDENPRCLTYLYYGSLTDHPTDKDRMVAGQKALKKFHQKSEMQHRD